MRRSIVILFFLGFVSAAMLFAQTAGQQTSTKAGTTQSTTKAATPHPTAPPVLWVTTPSGLKYQDVVVGKGPQPKEGDQVECKYVGRFLSGKVFDQGVYPFSPRSWRGYQGLGRRCGHDARGGKA